MEAARYLTPLGIAALVFATVLLIAPSLRVLRGLTRWRNVAGLLVAGLGFGLIGAGLVFADRWSSAVLPGIVATIVGHVVQRRFGGRAG